jgi:NET1-associated nuclear protein 1 (U3 small nucleolar RNA-associated protein 17)
MCLLNPITLISELEVSPSNRISRRDKEEIESSRVEHAVIDPSGEWMATIDRRENEDEFSTELYLKIWQWSESTWALNSRIDRPHGSHDVVVTGFSPQHSSRGDQLLMTTGLDGNVKTWCIKSLRMKDEKIEGTWHATIVNRPAYQ